jgi:hypothetical protein
LRARLRGDGSRARALLEDVRRLDPGHLQAALAQGDDDRAFEFARSGVSIQRAKSADATTPAR